VQSGGEGAPGPPEREAEWAKSELLQRSGSKNGRAARGVGQPLGVLPQELQVGASRKTASSATQQLVLGGAEQAWEQRWGELARALARRR
jgi:hypothetical protein